MSLRIGILTISDRSARGERADQSGPALQELVVNQGWKVVQTAVVPDDFGAIREKLASWADSCEVDILLTTGGTGFSPRDITPEATRAVVERLAPGICEAMRLESLKITPHAMLSRSIAGIRGRTLIINLPGSPKAAVENLQAVQTVLPHAIHLLQEEKNTEAGHVYSQNGPSV